MPAQATAYKVDMMKIIVWRAKSQDVKGDTIDFADLHSIVLASGPLPLPVLEARVDEWMRSHPL